MALTFGKINRSASFNPTIAFPLDARSYFESLEAAQAAALTAAEAGDSSTVYYYGETLAVVENSTAKLYIIQPDKTLKEVGASIKINENAFALTDGVLNLLGFADAVAGAQLIKNESGKLAWVKSTTTVEGLSASIEALESAVGAPATETAEATGLYAQLASKANSSDVYTKEETVLEIANAVAGANHLVRKIVDDVALYEASPDLAEKNTIYMVKVSTISGDSYKEYMRFDAEDGTVSFEQIGDTSISLEAYATKADLEPLQTSIQSNTNALASKASQDDLDATNVIVARHTTEIESLKTLPEVVAGHTTQLTNLNTAVEGKAAQSDLTSLQEVVNGHTTTISNKVDKVFSEVNGEQVAWTLLSPTDKQKLDNLSINEDGSVGISGTVAASKVEGLADWITAGRDTIPGLLSAENSSKLDGIEEKAQANIIEAIKIAGETTNLPITNKIVEIPAATETVLGVVKLSSEIGVNASNQLEVKELNVNKLVQTEEIILACGSAAGNTL